MDPLCCFLLFFFLFQIRDFIMLPLKDYYPFFIPFIRTLAFILYKGSVTRDTVAITETTLLQ